MRIELIISSFHVLIQDWCLTTMALEAKLRTRGIEPWLCDWKSHSLPLTYIRVIYFCSTFLKSGYTVVGNRTRVCRLASGYSTTGP